MPRRIAVLVCCLGILGIAAPGFAQGPAAASCDLPGYAPSVRPDPSGTPTEVGVGLMLIDLSSISDVNQSITLDALLTLQWTDHRLDAVAGCRYDTGTIWTPDIHLFNSATVQPRQPPQVLVSPDGNVVFTSRYTATIASTSNIAEFPFDERDEAGWVQIPVQIDERDILLRLGACATTKMNSPSRSSSRGPAGQPN